MVGWDRPVPLVSVAIKSEPERAFPTGIVVTAARAVRYRRSSADPCFQAVNVLEQAGVFGFGDLEVTRELRLRVARRVFTASKSLFGRGQARTEVLDVAVARASRDLRGIELAFTAAKPGRRVFFGRGQARTEIAVFAVALVRLDLRVFCGRCQARTEIAVFAVALVRLDLLLMRVGLGLCCCQSKHIQSLVLGRLRHEVASVLVPVVKQPATAAAAPAQATATATAATSRILAAVVAEHPGLAEVQRVEQRGHLSLGLLRLVPRRRDPPPQDLLLRLELLQLARNLSLEQPKRRLGRRPLGGRQRGSLGHEAAWRRGGVAVWGCGGVAVWRV